MKLDELGALNITLARIAGDPRFRPDPRPLATRPLVV